jgi:hypothetical protein
MEFPAVRWVLDLIKQRLEFRIVGFGSNKVGPFSRI